ncbi:GNAT family N-acetyltransferase [Thauera sp.]|jgi:predicted GNAT family N-acyltransferase|uniref:GNAT family N-acetyltransferase n=1 Tax=Thauera sp. TaxID=1905334 RepID=UPI00261ED058|nr:GNAT family N-acetyltransferase [Thauera sp.]MCK6409633.1 GNAT family N-acetyltransferase [Thauera sp.]
MKRAEIAVTVTDWVQAEALVLPVRTEVFVLEQGVPMEIERDELDPVCRHAIARAPGCGAIGTGRLLPDGHIGRMAVLRTARGAGVGGVVLQALIGEAVRLGMSELALSAQIHALGFYLRHGFEPCGEVFIEAGIAHRAMRRTLGGVR